jgi:hypothetical protein
VAEPQAAAAGAPVEGAALADDPLAAGVAGCCPHAAVRAAIPMTAAAARDATLRMPTSQSQRATTAIRDARTA